MAAPASPPRSSGACPPRWPSPPCWHWPPPRPSPRLARKRRWAQRSRVPPRRPHHPLTEMDPLGPSGPPAHPPAEPRGRLPSLSTDTQRGRPRFGAHPRSPLGSHGPWGPFPAPQPKKTSQHWESPAHPGCPLPQVRAPGSGPPLGIWVRLEPLGPGGGGSTLRGCVGGQPPASQQGREACEVGASRPGSLAAPPRGVCLPSQ